MKYYKIATERMSSSWTEEPQWLKDLIDKWEVGGRYCTYDGDDYAFVISPIEIDHKDALELSKEEAEAFLKQRYENTTVEMRDVPIKVTDEEKAVLLKLGVTNPTEKQSVTVMTLAPKLERLGKIYFKYAANHTGNISTETWTLANSPHHITGTCTVLNANTLTIEAGCQILFDGDYSLVINGTIICNGTAASRIVVSANDPAYATIGSIYNLAFSFSGADAGCSITYTDISYADRSLDFVNAIAGTPVFNHIHIVEGYGIYNAGATVTIANSKMEHCNTASGALTLSAGSTTLQDFHMYDCGSIVCTGSASIKLLRVLKEGATSHDTGGGWGLMWFNNSTGTLDIDDTYVLNQMGYYQAIRLQGTNPVLANCNIDTSIFTQSGTLSAYALIQGDAAGGNVTITDCDFMGINVNSYGVWKTGVLVRCSISACNRASRGNFDLTADGGDGTSFNYASTDTPAQFALVGSVTGMRSACYHNATPTSIVESGLGDNGITISWATTMHTEHRVRYGTTSGVYTMSEYKHDNWSDFMGCGSAHTSTKTPSIALANIKAGTIYYYICESWNWLTQTWETSAEGDFTTTSSNPVITNYGLTDYSITGSEYTTARCTATSSEMVIMNVNDTQWQLLNDAGNNWTKTIKGFDIGYCTSEAVSFIAYSGGNATSVVAASTLTIPYAESAGSIYYYVDRDTTARSVNVTKVSGGTYGAGYNLKAPVQQRGKSWTFRLINCGQVRKIIFYGEVGSDK